VEILHRVMPIVRLPDSWVKQGAFWGLNYLITSLSVDLKLTRHPKVGLALAKRV
jgi:hypothetical protein